jgi:hypothetical protein
MLLFVLFYFSHSSLLQIAREVLSTEEFYVQCLHFMVKHESGYWKKLSDPQWELAKHVRLFFFFLFFFLLLLPLLLLF